MTTTSTGTSTPPHLSICIPTFDRADLLKKTLALLLPQLTEACELVIIDNCSAAEVAPRIADLLAQFPRLRVRLLRNSINIGMGANILRCFEQAEGEWLWVLGDTDTPTPGAVGHILRQIERDSDDLTFLNFDSTLTEEFTKPVVREKDLDASGLEGFVHGIDSFSNILFLSAGIYRRRRVIPHLRHAYAYIDSTAPHLALLLLTLREGGNSRFCMERTIDWKREEPGKSWNLKVVTMKLPRLLELIPTPELRQVWLREFGYGFTIPLDNLKAVIKYTWRHRGDLGGLEDYLKFRVYLAQMVPGFHAWPSLIRLLARLASFTWPLYYGFCLLKRKPKPEFDLAESDLTSDFLQDNRL